jgi:hypothetical protein
MLSTNMRLRVQFICERIATGAPVELADMTWLQKLASKNPGVASDLRKARRKATGESSNMDSFLNDMDLGDPDPSNHLIGPQDPVTLAEWFSSRQAWFRGQVD